LIFFEFSDAVVLVLGSTYKVVAWNQVHIDETSRHVLLVLGTNCTYAWRINALDVVWLLLLRLFEFVVEGLELLRLFIHRVGTRTRSRASICVTTLELVHILVLWVKSFLSYRYLWTQSVQRSFVRTLLVLLHQQVWLVNFALIKIRHLFVGHLLIGTFAHAFSLLLLIETSDALFGLRHFLSWWIISGMHFCNIPLGCGRAWVVP
jgi:hypothetical protein